MDSAGRAQVSAGSAEEPEAFDRGDWCSESATAQTASSSPSSPTMYAKPCMYYKKNGELNPRATRHHSHSCQYIHPNDRRWEHALRSYDPEEILEAMQAQGRTYDRDKDRGRDRDWDRDSLRDRDRDNSAGPFRKRARHDSPPREGSSSSSLINRLSLDGRRPASPARPPSPGAWADRRQLTGGSPRTPTLAYSSPATDRVMQAAPVAPTSEPPRLPPPPRNVLPAPSAVPPSPTASMRPPVPPPSTSMSSPVQPMTRPASSLMSAVLGSRSSLSTMSIIQGIIGNKQPPAEDNVEEKRRRWIDRVGLIHKLVVAFKTRTDAEHELRLRTFVRNSSHFSKASGSILEKLEGGIRDAEADLAKASEEYDTLLKEFTSSDFWPLPPPSNLPVDAFEGLRHFYWQLESRIGKVEGQVTHHPTPQVAGAVDAVAGADGDMDTGEFVENPPKPASSNTAEEELAAKIKRDIITVVAPEIENLFVPIREALDGKLGNDQFIQLHRDFNDALTAIDTKYTELLRDYETVRGIAEMVTSQLVPSVNQELYPSVRTLEADIVSLKKHTDSSVADVRREITETMEKLRDVVKSEADKSSSASKSLVDTERTARMKLDATLGEHTKQVNALKQENATLKSSQLALKNEHATIKSENKDLMETNKTLKQNVERLEEQQTSHHEQIATFHEQINALRQAVTAIQATSQPSSEALKGELVHEVVERLHGDIKPVMENMIVNVEARLNEHSNDVFTAVIAKLSPILKVNETLYALIKKHELSHIGSATPPVPNGATTLRADGTPV